MGRLQRVHLLQQRVVLLLHSVLFDFTHQVGVTERRIVIPLERLHGALIGHLRRGVQSALDGNLGQIERARLVLAQLLVLPDGVLQIFAQA